MKIVRLVINKPKLPRLIADHMLIDKQQKNIGYTNKNGTFGTVKVNVIHTAIFKTQLMVSNISLVG